MSQSLASTRRASMLQLLYPCAGLILAHTLLSALIDWADLSRDREQRYAEILSTAGAVIGRALRGGVEEPAARLYVLALNSTWGALCGLAILALAVKLQRGARLPQRSTSGTAVEWTLLLLAIFPMLLVLAPVGLHPLPIGEIKRDSETARAFRDAVSFAWPAMLFTALPVLVAPGTREPFRVGTALAMVTALLTAALISRHLFGTRSGNELLAFGVIVAAAAYLGRLYSSSLENADRTHRELNAAMATVDEQRVALTAKVETIEKQRLTLEEQLKTIGAQRAALALKVTELGERRREATEAVAQLEAERERADATHQAAVRALQDSEARLRGQESHRLAFLSWASHDLKQPLAAATMYGELLAETLRSGPYPEKALNYAATLVQQLAALRSAFASILDYSSIASGQHAVNKASYQLGDLLAAIEQRFRPMAEERGLKLVIEGTAEQILVKTDRELLLRLLSNLVINAIKYTDPPGPGETRPYCVVLKAHASGLAATVDVIDYGRGIPPDKREAIFEAGVQLDNPERSSAKGFGLGLAVVRSIVTQAMPDHGIDLESEPGRGSCFKVRIPLALGTQLVRLDAGLQLSHETSSLKGMVVVVVEDDEAQLLAIKDALTVRQGHVIPCASFRELQGDLERLQRDPDLVLTDYRLPEGRSGIDVIRLAREMFGKHIPAVILSAEAGAAKVEAEGLGMTAIDYVRKPAALSTVLQQVAKHYTPVRSPLEAHW